MFESRHVGSSVLIRTVLKMVIYPCLLNLVPLVIYETYLSAGIHLKLKLKSQNIVKPVVGVQTLILYRNTNALRQTCTNTVHFAFIYASFHVIPVHACDLQMRAKAQSQMQEIENDSTCNILAFAFAVRCFLVIDTVCACVAPVKQPSETPSQQHSKQYREKYTSLL